jgi:hypothetical protein
MRRVIGAILGGVLAVGLFGSAAGATPVQSARASGTATLSAIHAIPNTPVDVYVNGTVTVPDFQPGTIAGPLSLGSGRYVIKLNAAGTETTLLRKAFTLEAGVNYSVVAFLSADGSPLMKAFRNDTSRTGKGMASLTVRHVAAAPAVDVWANGSVVFHKLTNGQSRGATVSKGVYAAWASLTGDYQPVIGPAVLKLESGVAYIAYAWGDGSNGYGLIVQTIEVGR